MNKYEIIGIVGEGAYGIVYKAKNKDTGEFGKWPFLYMDCIHGMHIDHNIHYSLKTVA